MQPGCGLRPRKIRGRWYVYGWHFNGQRGRQVHVYLGPAGRGDTNQRALQFLLEQEDRARAALARRVERYRAALDRMQSR